MPDVYGDVFAFCAMHITGLMCGLVYDLLRALTLSPRLRRPLVMLRDLLFWLLVGLLLSLTLVLVADGRMRFTFLFSSALGAAVYFILLSPIVFPPIHRVARTTYGLLLHVCRAALWITGLPLRAGHAVTRSARRFGSEVRHLVGQLAAGRSA